MRHLKNCFLLWLFLSHAYTPANGNTFINRQDADSLIRLAKTAFDKQPLTAIKIAKQAYIAAREKNNQTNAVKCLNQIAQFFYELHKYDSVKRYAQNALLTGSKLHNTTPAADSWQYIAMADYGKGGFEQAIGEYKKSVAIYISTRQQYSVAATYLNIGVCERKLAHYSDAINYFLKSAGIFESLHEDGSIAYNFNSIALCFVELNELPKALAYNSKALLIRRQIKDTILIAQSLNNIGFAFKKNNQPDSAIRYLSKSVTLYEKSLDSSLLVLPLQNLGSSWKMRGNLTRAENFVLRSLQIAAKYDMKEEIASGNLDLAELYLVQKKYQQAVSSIKITERIARELKLPEVLMDTYQTELDLYTKMGDFKTAIFYDKSRDRIKDSLFTIGKNKTIADIETKYQTRQKEKDIAALNIQNNLQKKAVSQQKLSITVLFIAALLLLLLLIIAYRGFLQKKKAAGKIQLLHDELNHRIKNNLQILSGLIIMQLDELDDEGTKNILREGEARLAAMNMIHDKLFVNQEDTKIEMNDYLTKLLNHIKVSFGGDKGIPVDLHIDVAHINIEADKAIAIGLIVNELATNSFKYAFKNKDGKLSLRLVLKSKSTLFLSVSDNGGGLNKAVADKKPGFGLKLVALLSTQLRANLIVKREKGTSYEMEINI